MPADISGSGMGHGVVAGREDNAIAKVTEHRSWPPSAELLTGPG